MLAGGLEGGFERLGGVVGERGAGGSRPMLWWALVVRIERLPRRGGEVE